MNLLPRPEPRRFRYLPRYLCPDKPERMRFPRTTLYDPHAHARMPWIYAALLALVIALVLILGGVRRPAKPPQLTIEDAVGTANHTEQR